MKANFILIRCNCIQFVKFDLENILYLMYEINDFFDQAQLLSEKIIDNDCFQRRFFVKSMLAIFADYSSLNLIDQ